jgi:two-component system response regulator PhoP
MLAFGPYTFNENTGVVAGPSGKHFLSRYESIILTEMVRNVGQVVTKDQLMGVLYPNATPPLSNGLEVFVRRIRVKLDPGGRLAPITTVRGQGYKLRADLPGGQPIEVPAAVAV